MDFIFEISINKYKILAFFWNVFLALLPCVTVYFMIKAKKKRKFFKLSNYEKISFVLLFFYWLFFFPNTIYLLTMSRHLVNYCSDFDVNRVCINESWIMFLFSFYTILALPSFYYSLKKMTVFLSEFLHKNFSIYFPVFIIPISSLGLMLGLFQRFNTWDLLFHPYKILQVIISYFYNLNLILNFVVFTIIMYIIYYGFDYFIKLIKD